MSILAEQIDDLVLLTQNKLVKRGAFVNMQTDLQDFVATRELWKGRQKKFEGGLNWEISYQMDHNHSAKAVALYETDGSAMGDTMVKGEVGPRHVNAHYVYDLREPAFQRGGLAVVDFLITKYSGMMISWHELLEEFLWGKPADDTDKKTPYGLAYWLTKNATEGFSGGNPTGFASGRANINSDTHTRYKNYSGKYAAITKEDLIRKMRNAARRTKFRSPLSHAEPTLGGQANGIYVNDTVIGLMEEILEKQNMNLGNDLASKDGRAAFKGTPLTWVPALDEDTSQPVYMLDWKWLAVGVMPGWENNLSKPYMVPNMHNVRRVDLDATLNMVCTDPRRQAVLYK